jgi:Bax protein
MPEIDQIRTRKQLFLSALLPAVLQVNEEIREVRRRLTAVSACQHAGYALSVPVQDWVAGLAAHYRTKPEASALLVKVAEIPPSMALAQAAVESGWGTSGPAQAGNSLFGQYMVEEEIVKGHVKKTKLRLAAFDSVVTAVRAYADNLNIHPAYAEFRERRTQMLEKGLSLDGMKLAESLGAYSKRKAGYIRDVQTMIRRNGLDALDRVDLASRQDILMN